MITLKQLGWSKKEEILSDISLNINEGDLIVFIGENGSGKSSLLRCISGWITPTKGRILLKNKAIHQYSHQERSSMLAMLPQRAELGEAIPVIEWLQYARFRFSESRKQQQQTIQALLQEYQIDHLASRSWSSLSGGEAQKIAMLAMIAQEAEIWLLDEPGNHLDPKIQQEVYRVIVDMWKKGKTVILVTHNLNLLLRELGKEIPENVRVFGMEKGKIAFENQLFDSTLLSNLEQLYRLPIQKIDIFGVEQLIFGSLERK